MNKMWKKSDIIESFEETFLIVECLDKQYLLFNLNNQNHELKEEEELHSNFNIIEVKKLKPENYINLMTYLLKSYKETSQVLWQYKKLCPHHIVNQDDSAYCQICETDFGHFCPDSPDNICYYFTENNGKILMNNGTQIEPPPNHNSKNETFDCCIFCAQPEERK
jgi:hypothetical protein